VSIKLVVFMKVYCCIEQLPIALGGGEGQCIYISTKGSFPAERIAEIAQTRGMQVSEVLDNILLMEPRTTDQMMECLAKAKVYMADYGKR
jgi:DNA repair protein RAD51